MFISNDIIFCESHKELPVDEPFTIVETNACNHDIKLGDIVMVKAKVSYVYPDSVSIGIYNECYGAGEVFNIERVPVEDIEKVVCGERSELGCVK